jgi:hypothetical protein
VHPKIVWVILYKLNALKIWQLSISISLLSLPQWRQSTQFVISGGYTTSNGSGFQVYFIMTQHPSDMTRYFHPFSSYTKENSTSDPGHNLCCRLAGLHARILGEFHTAECPMWYHSLVHRYLRVGGTCCLQRRVILLLRRRREQVFLKQYLPNYDVTSHNSIISNLNSLMRWTLTT